MLIDYHLHNHFSPDSHTDTRQLIEKMKSLGINDICITNHGEWFDQEDEIVGHFYYERAKKNFTSVKEEIDSLKNDFPEMNIGFGLELQRQPESMKEIKQFLSELPFDFILGSVHNVDGFIISGGKNGQDYFIGKTEEQAYTKYFEFLLEWVKTGDFDIAAHFDVIKKLGTKVYGPFLPQKYKPLIMEILMNLKNKGRGVELNTGSMHKRCEELFPHPDILKWCVEIGIEHYTFGSDAHTADDCGQYLDEAFAIAKDVGIKTVSTYKKRLAEKHGI